MTAIKLIPLGAADAAVCIDGVCEVPAVESVGITAPATAEEPAR